MMHNTGIKSEADTGALSVSGPQPAWMTLNEARDRAFTGEVVFEVDPEVLAYLDNGIVYYAERTSDVPLSRRLIEAGVVDAEQLERGTVSVGDVEHLGRLFDRDPSVDRDAVLVATEMSTEALIAELANHATTTVRVTAYRHHPSGVHRWFVAPLDGASMRPFAAVAQIETTVVDDLSRVAGTGDFTIEWDDLDDVAIPSLVNDEYTLFDPFREDEPVDHDGFEADATSVFDGFETDSPPTDELINDDFQVTWPDGTEHAASLENAYSETVDDLHGGVEESAAFVETDDAELRHDMPSLEPAESDEAVDEVPDDVAEAVRRAIAAIEFASIESATLAALDLDDLIDIEPAELPDVAVEPEVEAVSMAPDDSTLVETPPRRSSPSRSPPRW